MCIAYSNNHSYYRMIHSAGGERQRRGGPGEARWGGRHPSASIRRLSDNAL